MAFRQVLTRVRPQLGAARSLQGRAVVSLQLMPLRAASAVAPRLGGLAPLSSSPWTSRRFASGGSGLSREEIMSRISDVLKTFDKVDATKVCHPGSFAQLSATPVLCMMSLYLMRSCCVYRSPRHPPLRLIWVWIRLMWWRW